MYKGFIKDVVNARDIAFLYIVEPPGAQEVVSHEREGDEEACR